MEILQNFVAFSEYMNFENNLLGKVLFWQIRKQDSKKLLSYWMKNSFKMDIWIHKLFSVK